MTIPNNYPQEIGNNIFNRFIILSYRSIYILISTVMTVALGKKRKNASRIFQKLQKGNNVVSSFLLKIFIYKYLNKLGFKKETSIIYIPKYDYKFHCPLNMADYMSLFSREEAILTRFDPQPADIVVDIGANIGRYTVIAAKKVRNEGCVISIEANPVIYDLLTKNIQLNELTNVIPLNYAAFSKRAKIKFFVNKDLRNNQYGTINSDIDKFASKGLEQQVSVDANTVDSILLENGIKIEDVKWMKIDVEGAEFDVIKGSKELISNTKNLRLIIEIHNLSNGMTYHNEIKDFLESFDYKIDFEERRPSGESHIIFKKQIAKQ
ncbi:FkbM family methyltransferase [Candidatus Nitrosocosmicus franklandus]|uniref:Putative methyltransferase FkbM family n=1 Tax=Candidatus Nitrosocosmicus franklandianus TaxID=1798806 RepID=A0A484ID52_9ARCH|nr:FkbM family methyltransferase [Candidatus Nitrosocosmicus franklandus]VFJ13977.1 putative methyltransferase FkbM family [Candidatus Nitrosocosmicus franklandus]